ncbi:hypothetical protein HPB51_013385 [Rhipicephalus microplus]|uniref:Uncharacterized protein n=1 Tax=Rhipicephalus microplus TaxID=6941 RepID=A0A9J6F373_RHIMP|nr:hypothetical protein HPB51_013385 [Rhipicephalus microplus]
MLSDQLEKPRYSRKQQHPERASFFEPSINSFWKRQRRGAQRANRKEKATCQKGAAAGRRKEEVSRISRCPNIRPPNHADACSYGLYACTAPAAYMYDIEESFLPSDSRGSEGVVAGSETRMRTPFASQPRLYAKGTSARMCWTRLRCREPIMAMLLSQSQQRQPGSNNLYGNNQQTNCHRSDVDCVIARGERGCLRRPCSEWGPVGSVACHPDPLRRRAVRPPLGYAVLAKESDA